MAITKKIFFSETTGCRKLKLGIYVPTFEDILICSRRSDLISNMAAVTYFLEHPSKHNSRGFFYIFQFDLYLTPRLRRGSVSWL